MTATITITCRPIEEAPQDGTEILAYNVTHKHWKLVEYHATVDTEGWCVMDFKWDGWPIVSKIYNERYFQFFLLPSEMEPAP